MLCVYTPDCTDFTTNGLGTIAPSSALVKEALNGEYELEVVHPLDDAGKWHRLIEGYIIRAPVPSATTPRVALAYKSITDVKAIYKINRPGKTLVLRSSPGDKYKKLGKYKHGKQVIVLEKTTETMWEVVCPNGKRGYMPGQYLTFVRNTSDVVDATGAVIESRQLRDQPFRIYRVVPELDKVTAYARHVFYDLLENMVKSFKPLDTTAGRTVVEQFSQSCLSAHDFTFYSNLTTKAEEVVFENKNPVDCLMGEDGIIEKYGGELQRDWFDVFIVDRVGNDTKIQIRQGKNLTGIKYDVDTTDVVTRIMPTGEDKDGKLLYLPETYVDSPYVNNYPSPKWIHLAVPECKEVAKSKDKKAKTKAECYTQMRNAAQAEFDKGCDLPTVTLTVEFIDVTETEEYKQFGFLKSIFLGDTVRVMAKRVGVEVSMRMTAYTYNCLTRQYEKMTLGTVEDTVGVSMISSRQLPNGIITGSKLALGSVGIGQLQNGSVGYLQIQEAAITSAHIQDAAIGNAHIQNAAIGAANIQNAVNLSTDAFTFAGDTTKVKSTQSFSTTIYGYCGSKAVTAAVDTTAITLPTGVTVTSDDDTVAPTLTFTATTALTQAILTTFGGKIDLPIVLDGGDITLHKAVAISIALTGATGAAPYSILVGNEAQVIACDKDGKTLSAGTITIPFSIFQGTTRRACTVTYSSLPSGITLNKNTDGTATEEGSLVLNVAAASTLGGTSEGTITLTFKYGTTTIGTKTFTWSKSITGATGGQGPQGNPGTNGVSATSVVCGNEAVSIPCTLDGKAKAAMTITIPFAGYIATTRAACTVAYSTLPSGVTLNKNNAGTASADGSLLLNVAANANFGSDTTYTGEITLTFTCNSQTFVKKFTWSKAMTGATGGKGDKGDPGDDAITLAITSSNGTIFKNAAIATTLTAHVYQGGEELSSTQIAALGTVKWYKDGSTTAAATGQTLTITAGSIENKATYIAQLEG